MGVVWHHDSSKQDRHDSWIHDFNASTLLLLLCDQSGKSQTEL